MYGIDVRFFQEHKVYSLVHEIHIQCDPVRAAAAHAAHAIEHDQIPAADFAQQFVQSLPAKSCAGVCLFDDMCRRICGKDIPLLPLNVLLLGRDPAVTVDSLHDVSLASV